MSSKAPCWGSCPANLPAAPAHTSAKLPFWGLAWEETGPQKFQTVKGQHEANICNKSTWSGRSPCVQQPNATNTRPAMLKSDNIRNLNSAILQGIETSMPETSAPSCTISLSSVLKPGPTPVPPRPRWEPWPWKKRPKKLPQFWQDASAEVSCTSVGDWPSEPGS